MKVVYAPSALRDLERFADFVEQGGFNPPLEVIFDAVQILERHPSIGRPVRAELRELLASSGRTGFVVLYRARGDRVEVVAIRHQREAGYASVSAPRKRK